MPKQQKRNHGERERYFVTGSNDAIISQDTFDRAQALRKKRKAELAPIHNEVSRKIRCSCGARIRAKQVNHGWYWCCHGHDEKSGCPILPIPETQTEEAFCRLYHYWLFGHYHDNRAIDKKHILLWEQIVRII